MIRSTAVGAMALLLLAGCAPQPFTRSDLDGRVVCDPDRVAAVERNARRNNAQVLWINCPTATLRVVS